MFLQLKEPEWWKALLEIFSDFVDKNHFLSKTVPITADIFVFTYPVYLVYLYLYWVYNKNVNYKYASLYIFFSGINSLIISQLFQILVIKDRPDISHTSAKNLILEDLPNVSFPSDHTTLSMAIATSSLVWWIKSKNKFFIIVSFVLFVFSFTMWFSRVLGGYHRPTDIIAGIFLGAMVPIIMIHKKVFWFFKKFVYNPLIKLQCFLFDKLLGIKE